ncbi:MAG: hypothetical protein K0U47_02245 [Epsilonproteobacteria bacterium]|nr:hypothetical protein [Campylobacterota bacterium]
MIKKTLLTGSLLAALLIPSTSSAENISIGTQAGIFGIGLNAKYKIDEHFGVRAGFDMINLNDYEVEDGDLEYNFDVELQDVLVVADWHPWQSAFRTSAGIMLNNSNVEGEITPSSSVGDTISFTFNGESYSYSTDEVGAIEATADLDPVAPYIGIGWDTSFNKKKGFGFTFDLGIAFQGSIQTDYDIRFGDDLDIDKQTANLPDGAQKEALIAQIKSEQQTIKDNLKDNIDAEMNSLQDKLDKYEIVPYISIGFNYKF